MCSIAWDVGEFRVREQKVFPEPFPSARQQKLFQVFTFILFMGPAGVWKRVLWK